MARRVRRLQVNGYSEGWLRKGFPWVYAKEVVGRGRVPAPGSEVLIQGRDGRVLGRGLADAGWIAARVYRHDEGPLDQDWLHAVLDRAAALRAQVIDPKTTGYRLVNAECDGLPGVRVDWWDHYAVITLDSAASTGLVDRVVHWLVDRRDPRGIYLAFRPDPRDEGAREVEPGWVHGRPCRRDVRVLERGLAFLVRPQEGPDVGLYADMRDVRAWLEPFYGGRRVLNTFAFTGAFSVAAVHHGASEVVSVDLSEPALERCEANLLANDLPLDSHEAYAMDTFKALDRFRRKGREFDLVVLDPPSFARCGDGSVWTGRRDWPRLISGALRVLAPDGWLLIASNQGQLSPRKLRGFITSGFKKARRRGQELWRGSQAADFPAASWFPEGRYLKVSVWRVPP